MVKSGSRNTLIKDQQIFLSGTLSVIGWTNYVHNHHDLKRSHQKVEGDRPGTGWFCVLLILIDKHLWHLLTSGGSGGVCYDLNWCHCE